MVVQYPDLLSYTTATVGGQDEWGVPIETLKTHQLKGRYENYSSGNRKEFIDKGGETVFATAKYLAEFGQDLPPRFVTAEVRGMRFEILNVHQGQMNITIYLREVK